MPYRIYGGQRFYDRLEIKNALAYLRLILNRQDDSALERVINTPTRGIGNKTVEAIRLTAREQGCALVEAAQALVRNNVLSARAANAVKGFLDLLDQLEVATAKRELADQVALVINDSGLLQFHENEKGERGQARVRSEEH